MGRIRKPWKGCIECAFRATPVGGRAASGRGTSLRKLSSFSFILLLASASCAWAQSELGPEYEVHIDRQPLSAAILELAIQLDQQTLQLDARTRASMLVGPLHGRFTADEAIRRLLENTGYSYRRLDAENFVLVAMPDRQSAGEAPRTDRRRRVDGELYASRRHREGERGRGPIIEEVRVTGTRLGRAAGGAPIVVLDREQIDRLGVSSVTELLLYVSQQPFVAAESMRTDGAQFANIRGIGSDMTVVLLNGRRTAPSATTLAVNALDLNRIPLPAVDRVEVLSDAASAVYGTDAVAGVINIILKQDFDGLHAGAGYGLTQGGRGEQRGSLSLGDSEGRARGSIVLDYYQRGYLMGEERDLWRDQDYRRFGGTDWRSETANPGNVTSVLPGNLPGLISRFAAVPKESSGIALTPTDFETTAGHLNYESLQRFWSVLPEVERRGALAQAEWSLGASASAFGEVLLVHALTSARTQPPAITEIVPATNPFNPFGVDVNVSYLMQDLGATTIRSDSEMLRAVAGVRGQMGSWAGELALIRSREDGFSEILNQVDLDRLQEALSETDPSRAFNPFAEGAGSNAELLNSLRASPTRSTFESDVDDAIGYLRGPLFAVPAGHVTAVLGTEWRREVVRYDLLEEADSPPLSGAHERTVAAGFAELSVPIVGAPARAAGMHALSADLAVRFDRYSDVGESLNPQYALTWRPRRNLSVRASYGTSFRPPSLFDLYTPQVGSEMSVADPRRGDEITSAVVVAGGNRDLQSIEAESFSAAVQFTPESRAGWRFSATYWQTRLNDRVAVVPQHVLLANEARYPDRVLREEPTPADIAAGRPGRLRQITVTRMNVGPLETSGVDFAASFPFDTNVGKFAPTLAATWVGEFSTLHELWGVERNRVDKAHPLGTIPRWRVIGQLAWSGQAIDVSGAVRYVPAYADAAPTGEYRAREVPAQLLFDAQVRLDLGRLAGSTWEGFELRAGLINAFDEAPSFAEVGASYGYDQTQGDLRGRFGYVRLFKEF
jgi:iron complex outermembrane receptor protein